MYKLVAIDLDGTLLNSEKRISDENRDTLKQAMNKGVKIVICSGRIFAGARIFANHISNTEPLISCNGAVIKDTKTNSVIYSRSLAHNQCYKVIDICHDEDVYFHTYIGDTMYTEKLAFSSLFYWNRNQELSGAERVDIRVEENMKNLLGKITTPVSKIVVISKDRNKLLRTRELLEEIEGVNVTSSNYDNLEIMKAGVNKGAALKFLAEKMGIKREEVIALGDNENDKPMLEYAGFSIAMGNGEDYIKEIADYVTLTNNENGVAHAIKKFIL